VKVTELRLGRPETIMRIKVLALVVGTLLVAGSLSARVKVQADGDPNFDFAPLKTFNWPVDGAGQVKMALTKDDDPEAFRRSREPALVAAVEAHLTARGYVKMQPGAPSDFTVAYFALISTNQQAQTMGQFLPGSVSWGLPPFLAVTQSLKIFEQGALVIDVRRPDGNVVWRGVAQAELHRDRPDAERNKRLTGVVNDILKQFPPKKKK
jgi:Domain of unknown function (DUF4136)